jgi:hypothetical protein
MIHNSGQEEAMNLPSRTLLRLALAVGFAAGQGYAICVVDSSVFGTPFQTDPVTWTYNFSVVNGCAYVNQPFMSDFYIPYFSDADIANIMVPPPDSTSTTSTITWTATIEPTNDLFNLGAGVIDFQVTATPELQPLPGVSAPGVGYYGVSGFSFTSSFAPVEGPWAILQYLGPNYTTTTTLFGDPSIPGSPETIAALEGVQTPEPGTLALVGLLLCAVPVLRKRFS